VTAERILDFVFVPAAVADDHDARQLVIEAVLLRHPEKDLRTVVFREVPRGLVIEMVFAPCKDLSIQDHTDSVLGAIAIASVARS
jgi:hypothetical protein